MATREVNNGPNPAITQCCRRNSAHATDRVAKDEDALIIDIRPLLDLVHHGSNLASHGVERRKVPGVVARAHVLRIRARCLLPIAKPCGDDNQKAASCQLWRDARKASPNHGRAQGIARTAVVDDHDRQPSSGSGRTERGHVDLSAGFASIGISRADVHLDDVLLNRTHLFCGVTHEPGTQCQYPRDHRAETPQAARPIGPHAIAIASHLLRPHSLHQAYRET